MSYEAKEWVNGEIITAENLNHIENGIAESGSIGGAEVVVVSMEAYRATPSAQYEITSDKTFSEIEEAHENGAVIVLRLKEQTGSNPYSVQSGIADVRTTFNEQGQSVVSGFSTVKIISGYMGDRVEIGITSSGAYYSYFSS